MKLRVLRDVPKKSLRGKRVLLRVDFDVPVRERRVLDDFRIRAALPTIRWLLSAGARILILTKRGHFDVSPGKAMSTAALIPHLEKLTDTRITFIKDFPQLDDFSRASGVRQLFLFENLRFWKEEEGDSVAFAQRFVAAGDFFVSDNFGTAHRNHATVTELPKLLPSYAGFLLEKEVAAFEKIMKRSERPVAAVMGGIKLETKLPLITRFLSARDYVLLGGALANESVKHHPNLFLPLDGPKKGKMLLDVGPKTIRQFAEILRRAKMIVWNGPMGLVEKPRYAKGTIALAKIMQKLNAFKVVGGGDTVAFLERKKLLKGFDHVSTGGGAMLVFLAGEKLPGIEVFRK